MINQFFGARKMVKIFDYPLVMTNGLLLKMAIEIVDLPIKNGDFP